MSGRHRSIAFCAVIAAFVAGLAVPGYAQKSNVLARNITLTYPQFVAQAVSFKALDETGPDWPGSDEVKVVFADFNSINEHVTDEYADVDTGETKRFRSSEQCIARQPGCTRGSSSLHFGIGLWEQDSSFPGVEFCGGILAGSINAYHDGPCGWPEDLIGRVEVKLDRAQLVAALPAVGDAVNQTVKPTGGSGRYEVTYRITRLDDVQRTIVINIPPDRLASISLQAMVGQILGGVAVSLTWSGATTATVDLYRNATKQTIANDGNHTEVVGTGSYQYRLCNLNSTSACSAIVTVTVP